MAITKRLRVSFDIKVVERDITMDQLAKLIAKEVKGLVTKGEPLLGEHRAFITASLTGGPESAYEFGLKKALIDLIKEEVDHKSDSGYQATSNFSVRVIK